MKSKDEVFKTEQSLAQKVQAYEKELASVKRAADQAQGIFLHSLALPPTRSAHRMLTVSFRRGTTQNIPT